MSIMPEQERTVSKKDDARPPAMNPVCPISFRFPGIFRGFLRFWLDVGLFRGERGGGTGRIRHFERSYSGFIDRSKREITGDKSKNLSNTTAENGAAPQKIKYHPYGR